MSLLVSVTSLLKEIQNFNELLIYFDTLLLREVVVRATRDRERKNRYCTVQYRTTMPLHSSRNKQ